MLRRYRVLKMPGARPVYVYNDEPYGTNRNIPTSSVYVQNTVQGSLNSNLVYAVGMKRPASDRSQPAGGKKPCISVRRTLRQEHLDKIFSQLAPDKDDKQASKRLVDYTLKFLLGHDNLLLNGDQIYSQQFIYGGSYPVKTKIGKADEFDVIIPLNIDCEKVRLNGKVRYSYGDENSSNTQNFERNRQLCYEPNGKSIPNGYAVVDVKVENGFPRNPVTRTRNVPTCFLHQRLKIPIDPLSPVCLRFVDESCGLNPILIRLCGPRDSFNETLNRSETSPACIELIPWDIKRLLYHKILLRSHMSRVLHIDVSPISHGPALTITIKPRGRDGITHHINVDITPSLQCNIPVSKFGWPREKTQKAFRHVDIEDVLEAGTHLVPKKDLFWALSFSKAEKTLLKCLDRDKGCRKYVTKLLKKLVQTCSSQSPNGLPGISSHIIKTQVLWSCEKHSNDPNYWHWDNRDACLIMTMKELVDTLRSRRLSEYFNPVLNILEGKADYVLDTLADFILCNRKQLMIF